MSDYITDPELLKKLNGETASTETPSGSVAPSGSATPTGAISPTENSAGSEYITDPELLKQLGSGAPMPAPNNTAPNPANNLAQAAAVGAVRPAMSAIPEIPGAVRTAASKLGSMDLKTLASLAADVGLAAHGAPPLATVGKYALSPQSGMSVGQALKGVGGGMAALGRGLGTALAGPENIIALPYQMAAYEAEKIRANPNAPEYAKNPYAMSYRSQGTANPITQGQAGAQNTREAIATMPTGYTPTAAEAKNLLDSGNERMINLYGGRMKLEGLASPGPNAIKSGYTQELKRLGR